MWKTSLFADHQTTSSNLKSPYIKTKKRGQNPINKIRSSFTPLPSPKNPQPNPPPTNPAMSPSPLFFLLLFSPLLVSAADAHVFREAPSFRNGPGCAGSPTIHIAMTLDATYLRGSLAGVLSVLQHSSCPQNIRFHFLSLSPPALRRTLLSVFPSLPFSIYRFDPSLVRSKISSSVRPALNQPLNYARIYLADILPPSVSRVIYLDSDLIVVDDVSRLWSVPSNASVLAAPEYCHANFTSYFTPSFWSHPAYPRTFESRSRRPCYFNTGVMVMDLGRWRRGGYTRRLEGWMGVQKRVYRIYELGSLPPFLLVFAGEVEAVEHRWNQHGLGGDNVEGLCRDLHPGPVSLLHWSGKGKPWLRLDKGRPCPLDHLWKPYDLLRRKGSDLFADG